MKWTEKMFMRLCMLIVCQAALDVALIVRVCFGPVETWF